MDTYLLLRSNKKSGPYSFDQLINLGLKPYDLVWVEGKSAAWRYPGEVDTLKEYAPSVEEQPFDRFYKKPNEEKAAVKPLPKQEQVLELPEEVRPVKTTRKVFVSMPEHQFIQRSVQPAAARTQTIIQEKVEEKKPIPVKTPIITEEKTEERKPIHEKTEPTLNEKYSESLDDIKKRYEEVYLTRKKKAKWNSTAISLLQIVGGAVFFCILVVAAYKNFSGDDKSESSSKATKIQPRSNVVSNTNTAENTSPAISSTINQQDNKTTKNQPVANQDVKTLVERFKTKTTAQQTGVTQRENKEPALAEIKPEKKAVMPPPSTEAKAEEKKSKPHPVNIANLVNVKANNYKQRAFGGVLNLELTVNNESKFALDKVIVELQYLKPSEQPLKTDKIVFNDVAPGGSQTLKIPDYLRGIKVVYKIIGIESSQYQSYTAGL